MFLTKNSDNYPKNNTPMHWQASAQTWGRNVFIMIALLKTVAQVKLTQLPRKQRELQETWFMQNMWLNIVLFFFSPPLRHHASPSQSSLCLCWKKTNFITTTWPEENVISVIKSCWNTTWNLNRQIKTRKGTRRWWTIKNEEMAQSLQQMIGTGTVCRERLSSALSSSASFDCPQLLGKKMMQ